MFSISDLCRHSRRGTCRRRGAITQWLQGEIRQNSGARGDMGVQGGGGGAVRGRRGDGGVVWGWG